MIAALEGGEWSAARPGRTLPPGKTRYTGGWVGPRAGLDGRKISSHRDSIPDRPAGNQSLYRLSYPAHFLGPMKEEIVEQLRVNITFDFSLHQKLRQVNHEGLD